MLTVVWRICPTNSKRHDTEGSEGAPNGVKRYVIYIRDVDRDRRPRRVRGDFGRHRQFAKIARPLSRIALEAEEASSKKKRRGHRHPPRLLPTRPASAQEARQLAQRIQIQVHELEPGLEFAAAENTIHDLDPGMQREGVAVDEQVDANLARLPCLQRMRDRHADAVGADVGSAALDGRLTFQCQYRPRLQDLACGSPLIDSHDCL